MRTEDAGHDASGPALAVRDAAKRFGEVQALAGVSLDVRRGELLGLLGPNGAGKTTLIRALAGRLALDAGTVTLFGRALGPADPRAEIGVAPQELAVYPKLTASENLEVFGRLYGVSRAALAERVKWALAWAGLDDRAREPVARFSGGMKRRLNLACALVHAPTLVLLDEPTVGVDPQSRERIYDMLGVLQQSGVSIVLTTHHLEEAEQRCERIVIIDAGRIVAEGTVGELIGRAFGPSRRVRVTLATPLEADRAVGPGARIDDARRVVTVEITDTGAGLVEAVRQVVAVGGAATDVALAGATLQDVFMALTGRELRE